MTTETPCQTQNPVTPDRLVITYDGVEAPAEWDCSRQLWVVQSGPLAGVGIGVAPDIPVPVRIEETP